MNPAELLVMLTARTNKFERMPTGIPDITQQDLSNALALINHRIASLLLRVKYANQYDYLQKLDIRVWLKVVSMSIENGWQYPKDRIGREFYHDMARMALAEAIWPHTCLWCHGTGHIVIHKRRLRGKKSKRIGQVIMCEACKGTGRKRPTERQRARLMNIPLTTWLRRWASVYRDIQIELDKVEAIGLGALRRRLRGS